jgi:hypothetical protein
MRPLMFVLVSAVASVATAAAPPAFAQTAEQSEAVRKAMKAAYIREDAVEPCKPVAADRFGWSKDVVVRCVYVQRDKPGNVPRKAVAEAIFPEPAVIARWIVSACGVLKTAKPKCFSRTIAEGRGASGFQFAVTGNVLEDFPETGNRRTISSATA